MQEGEEPATQNQSTLDTKSNSTKLDNTSGIDSSCVYNIKNKLVRIQYPGIVKDYNKAIETLGGIVGIEKALSTVPNKLYLNLHPINKFSKGCLADYDSDSGLLLKVIVQKLKDGSTKYSHEVVGVTVRNFIFNKLIDFQYLPLVPNYPETSKSEVEYVYGEIVPQRLPTFESALDKKNMTLFLPPSTFARADTQKKWNPVDKKIPNNIDQQPMSEKNKKQFIGLTKLRQERPCIFHKFLDPEIPQRPNSFVSEVINYKNYNELLNTLQNIFQERPIWTKNGLRYNSKITDELLKMLMPAVAYFEITGPWRNTWIRFGYDPRKDPEARKFQVLDYRLPGPISLNLFSFARKPKMLKSVPTSLHKLPAPSRQKSSRSEDIYILRPNMLPPSRQFFYQYCDILLPEIQTMLARLPPVPPNTHCDPKNGWFPKSFVEQCRETVNKYIDEQASHELTKNYQESLEVACKSESEPKSTDYCSLMIKNVKRGLYKESNPLNMKTQAGSSTSNDIIETQSITEIMDSDSEDSVYSFYQEYGIEDTEFDDTDGILVHREEENTQDNMDIDVDALEDIKIIIANTSSNDT